MDTHKKIKRLNIISFILLVAQAISYLNRFTHEEPTFTNKAKMVGYHIGYNFFLIVAIVLFIKAQFLKKKLHKMDSFRKSE